MERRDFLKGAAAAAAATTVTAQAAEPKAGAKPAKGEKQLPGDIVIERPGSDFMVDVIKTLEPRLHRPPIPASSFRSLHESLVNYGGNKMPELLTCMHEESAVAMAHGYAKAAGKPMGVIVHGTVGLQHACDGDLQRLVRSRADHASSPATAWTPTSGARAPSGTTRCRMRRALVRDFVKWDDCPLSLQHFAESTVRAYKIAMTPPHGAGAGHRRHGSAGGPDPRREPAHPEARAVAPAARRPRGASPRRRSWLAGAETR